MKKIALFIAFVSLSAFVANAQSTPQDQKQVQTQSQDNVQQPKKDCCKDAGVKKVCTDQQSQSGNKTCCQTGSKDNKTCTSTGSNQQNKNCCKGGSGDQKSCCKNKTQGETETPSTPTTPTTPTPQQTPKP